MTYALFYGFIGASLQLASGKDNIVGLERHWSVLSDDFHGLIELTFCYMRITAGLITTVENSQAS